MRFKQLLPVIAGLVWLTPCAAAEEEDSKWYAVEIIVFAHQDPALDSEAWPEEPGVPDTLSAVELLRPEPGQAAWVQDNDQAPDTPVPFQRLTPSDYRLGDIKAKLEGSRRHKPLLHTAWLQPGLPREEAAAVHVYEDLERGGERRGGDKPERAVDTLPEVVVGFEQASASPAETEAVSEEGQAADHGMPVPPRLDGTLRLTLSRYLHLEADLVYRLPMEMPVEDLMATTGGRGDNVDAGGTEMSSARAFRWFQAYRMRDKRRMRSGELHYLDHPIIGIIALVSRHELPESPPSPAEPALEPVPSASPTNIQQGLIERD